MKYFIKIALTEYFRWIQEGYLRLQWPSSLSFRCLKQVWSWTMVSKGIQTWLQWAQTGPPFLWVSYKSFHISCTFKSLDFIVLPNTKCDWLSFYEDGKVFLSLGFYLPGNFYPNPWFPLEYLPRNGYIYTQHGSAPQRCSPVSWTLLTSSCFVMKHQSLNINALGVEKGLCLCPVYFQLMVLWES